MKWSILGFLLALTIVFLPGCMYPSDNLAKNQVPYQDQIDSVQKAVDSYKKDNGGILPIKTEAAGTPIYQKYPIDFKKMIPRYLPEPPGSAFESGGIYDYVLVDAETNPKVKLIDLSVADTIRDINLRIKSKGYPPYKKQIADNVYTLDFKQLGFDKPPYAESPYTHQNLPFVIDGNATVYVDYRADLYQTLKKYKGTVKPGQDIRSILVDNSMFVPAYSLPYTIDSKTKEPVFLEKKQ